MRIILFVTCIAALCLGCGEDSPGSAGGSGGSVGTGGSGGTGGTPTEINGCNQADAIDMTGMANVTITEVAAWVVTHSACIRVSANTVVTWQGNFSDHPLAGGVTPTEDATSPISMANATSGSTDASVTMSSAGTYPYFCTIHREFMEGVIYVE
jgi:plastocyanin